MSNAPCFDFSALKIGATFNHRNGQRYVIIDFAEDKDGELTVVHMNVVTHVVYVRTLSNFCGRHTDKFERRFTKVQA